jgi:DNA-binding CsgD family transcriptional regulator
MNQPLPYAERLERGRAAFEARVWDTAHSELVAAHREQPLAPDDLEMLAVAADLSGNDAEAIEYRTAAYRAYVLRGESRLAARSCAWLATHALLVESEIARCNGWLARGRRLLDESTHECAEHGFLLLPAGLLQLFTGRPQEALAAFEEAYEFGLRYGDPDLIYLGRTGAGHATLRLGRIEAGMAFLDEVMAGVTAGEVSAVAVGIIFCAVLTCCHDFFDMRRAQEWSAAFSRWCQTQPALHQFRGECLVHRAAILHLQGAWPVALAEVERACAQLAEPGSRPWAGAAFYQQAEIHRLRGELARAEEMYRLTSQWGRTPQPGLALLRLAQGRADLAAAALARELLESSDPASRSRLLAAHVEVMLAAGDLAAARSSLEELSHAAADLRSQFLHAQSRQAEGAVRLAEGEPARALPVLRNALGTWLALEAPYEAARTRILIGRACRELGDEDGARLEIEAAHAAFRQLGTSPEAAAGIGARRQSGDGSLAVLSQRELEVLRLIAAGKTNRAIAGELSLSEHTVRRHAQNIFSKLGVSTRAGATALLFQGNGA